MGPARVSKKIPAALGSRQLPSPTSTRVTAKSQASSSSKRLSANPPKSSAPPLQRVILRYERYQEDMPVRSVEVPTQSYTGLRHYTSLAKQHKFDTKPSLDHLNYLSKDADDADDAEPKETNASRESDPEVDTTSLAYKHYPARPPLQNNYSQPIYFGTTRNHRISPRQPLHRTPQQPPNKFLQRTQPSPEHRPHGTGATPPFPGIEQSRADPVR